MHAAITLIILNQSLINSHNDCNARSNYLFYLQLTVHADAKRIHSFKCGMEIAKRLKFTLLQRSKELLKYTPSYRTSKML